MQTKLKAHFIRNEIFYRSIRTSVVLIALVAFTLGMEMVIA